MHCNNFSASAYLLEYDTRFSVYGADFIFYDYRSPLEIPKELGSSFDVVVADPPFLSEECLTKTALTMRYLSKGPLILCTGVLLISTHSKLNISSNLSLILKIQVASWKN